MSTKMLEWFSNVMILIAGALLLLLVWDVIPFNRTTVVLIFLASNGAWGAEALTSSKLSINMAQTIEEVRKQASGDRKNLWSVIKAMQKQEKEKTNAKN